jgi:hypothetical protein
MGLSYTHIRGNTRLGICVTVQLEVFPWQRVLRQTVTQDAESRTLRGGIGNHGRLTAITRSQQNSETTSRMEAGSNTSTVALRDIGGKEKRSLKSEIVRHGRQANGTQTRE